MKSTFSGFITEADDQVLVTEAFNSAPYDLTFGKKSAGDIFFTFHDEDDKEFRIQFYTPQGLGRNVRQVFIGTKKGASYLDSQQKFKNPLRVASTMIDATKQFLDTPIGKSIDGFAINFSKKVMDRGIKLLPKIIRQSGLKQKLNVMDLNYSPDDSRGYVWVVRKGKDPAAVFDGPKMKGITWDDPDKVGDVPVQQTASAGDSNADWNISVMAKSNGIESTTVKINGDSVTLSSKDVAIAVRDRVMAILMKDQTIAQVTVFDKQFVGRGEVNPKQGKGWELKADGKVVAYIEFGVGATAPSAGGPAAGNVDYEDKGQWKYTPPNRGEQPQIVYVKKSGNKVFTALLTAHYTEPGTYVLNDSNHKVSKGPSAALLVSSARLPEIPTSLYNQFWKDAKTFWEGISSQTKPELNQARWLALQRAAVNIPNMTSVVSSTTAVGRLYVGNQGSVIVSINKGIMRNDDPVTVTIKAIDSKEKPLDYLSIMRDIDITKPAELTKAVKAKVDEAVKAINTKVPPSAALDAQAMLATLKALGVDRREIDWQFVESGNGKITVTWDLTFRRNSRQGAFKEHASSIRDANAAMNRMQVALQNKGYKTEIYLVTLQDAIDIDTQAEVEDGTAYSEYEQSIGSQLTGTK